MSNDIDWMPEKSPAVADICYPRWLGWSMKKPDPCDGCPLYDPCIKGGYFPNSLSKERMITWRNSVNAAAEGLRE